MTINLKQLIADREAGTEGPWDIPYMPGMIYAPDGPLADCFSNEQDARRIARLPDLEEAFLEAVQLLEQYAQWIGGYEAHWFLEKLK